jgi:hypothetical protein
MIPPAQHAWKRTPRSFGSTHVSNHMKREGADDVHSLETSTIAAP